MFSGVYIPENDAFTRRFNTIPPFFSGNITPFGAILFLVERFSLTGVNELSSTPIIRIPTPYPATPGVHDTISIFPPFIVSSPAECLYTQNRFSGRLFQ